MSQAVIFDPKLKKYVPLTAMGAVDLKRLTTPLKSCHQPDSVKS